MRALNSYYSRCWAWLGWAYSPKKVRMPRENDQAVLIYSRSSQLKATTYSIIQCRYCTGTAITNHTCKNDFFEPLSKTRTRASIFDGTT